jgi:hypothetical protein
MNLKQFSNEDLISKTERAVRVEREASTQVVRLFQEISERKLFLKRGFPSLYDMVTKQFGYCAGSAMRRINSMRLIQAIPEVEAKIESGELSLSVASEVQSFFYAEAKESRPYSMNAKIELIETCLNKSKREVEMELCRRNPEREKRESVRQISNDRLRVSFSITDELNQKLDRLKDLMSHSDPNLSTEHLLGKLVELGLDKFDPIRKAKRARERREKRPCVASQKDVRPNSPPPAEVIENVEEVRVQSQDIRNRSERGSMLDRTRYIEAAEQHRLAEKDDGLGCVFVDPVTKRRCSSKRFVETDHVVAFSCGGSNKAENLQPMCSAHNKFRWRTRAPSRVEASRLIYDLH